jgi:hypothetical protein
MMSSYATKPPPVVLRLHHHSFDKTHGNGHSVSGPLGRSGRCHAEGGLFAAVVMIEELFGAR